ncbi:hypothetical protein D049_0530A, partial [Vibrio parahaemolyticus VPTS-2010]
MIHRRHR